MPYVTITCARNTDADCLMNTAIDENELRGDGGGDPDLLPILVPPHGWISDPDGDGIICRQCATKDELNAHIDQVEQLEREQEDDGA